MQSACLCAVLLLALAHGRAAARTWTDSNGRTVEAEYAGMQGDSVLLRMSPDKVVPFPLVRLSGADQAFAKSQAGSPATSPPLAAPSAGPGATPRPGAALSWPQTVEVSARSLEIAMISENAAERKYVYRSEAFEFTSQAKLAGSVMKEVARTFEATRSLVNAMPWSIVCKPPQGRDRFVAALFETRTDYTQAGGPEMSGGVYSSGDKIFKIPFESLGLLKRGQTWFKDDFSNDTLIHEITHQLMDDYLGFMPTWVVEGTAEYTEMLPYKSGTFRAEDHKSAMKKQFEASGRTMLDFGSLEEHFRMNRDSWRDAAATRESMRDLYVRSLLLVYFFCHLDGDKKGARFIQYMQAVQGQVGEMRAFFADPRVKQMGGGRYTYPSSLKAPDMGNDAAASKNLPILLGERSFTKLGADLVEGYKTIGFKITVR